MRIFQHFNAASPDPCPICRTRNDGEVVLAGIDGTTEGNVEQGAQIHLACLELRITDRYGARFIYQRIEGLP